MSDEPQEDAAQLPFAFEWDWVRVYEEIQSEIGTPGGRAAREAVLTWAVFPLQTLVAYSKKDKYGRRIADLEMDGDRLSDELVKRGLAVRKEY